MSNSHRVKLNFCGTISYAGRYTFSPVSSTKFNPNYQLHNSNNNINGQINNSSTSINKIIMVKFIDPQITTKQIIILIGPIVAGSNNYNTNTNCFNNSHPIRAQKPTTTPSKIRNTNSSNTFKSKELKSFSVHVRKALPTEISNW